jgi:hypothetical protein
LATCGGLVIRLVLYQKIIGPIANPMPLVFSDTVILHLLWGGQSSLQAGVPAGWTRWKASPQAEKPAPQFV